MLHVMEQDLEKELGSLQHWTDTGRLNYVAHAANLVMLHCDSVIDAWSLGLY
jgi:hypothetical protein